jgi:hypothetical protein
MARQEKLREFCIPLNADSYMEIVNLTFEKYS